MNEATFRETGLTLSIERLILAPRRAVWRCWTEPALFKQWFCPRPWSVPQADFDLRPGGRMNCGMQGPDGERVDTEGIWLEIAEGTRLVFTDSFAEGYTPRPDPFITSTVELSDGPNGSTFLVWSARHANESAKRKHLEMGFEQGWTAASAQLEELAQSLASDTGGGSPAMTFAAKTRACLFLKDQAEEAARFYVSLIPDSRIDAVYRPDPAGPPLVVEFSLAGTPYMTLNGNPDPVSSHFASISVLTEDQAETDGLWAALVAHGGEEGQCGWLKDRFGAYWQIVPKALPRLMHGADAAAANRVSAALMTMTRIDIAQLEAAAQHP